MRPGLLAFSPASYLHVDLSGSRLPLPNYQARTKTSGQGHGYRSVAVPESTQRAHVLPLRAQDKRTGPGVGQSTKQRRPAPRRRGERPSSAPHAAAALGVWWRRGGEFGRGCIVRPWSCRVTGKPSPSTARVGDPFGGYVEPGKDLCLCATMRRRLDSERLVHQHQITLLS